jgi:hypothetical protein
MYIHIFKNVQIFVDLSMKFSPLYIYVYIYICIYIYVYMYMYTCIYTFLQDLLEPPNMSNVKKSFDYLHYAGMITEADDVGEVCI